MYNQMNLRSRATARQVKIELDYAVGILVVHEYKVGSAHRK